MQSSPLDSQPDSAPSAPSGSRVYYGWWITGLCFTNVAARRGSETAYSVLLVALVADLGWERGTITGAFALSMLIAGFLSPVAGLLYDRFPPRLALSLGSGALGVSALALSWMQHTVHLYFIMAVLFAPALALLNLGALSAYLSRWFVCRRAFSLGLSQAGQGFGIFILTPLVSGLMSMWGWRLGYLGFGLGLLVLMLPLNLLVARTGPQQLGLLPDGVGKPSDPAPGAGGQGGSTADFARGTWTLARARRTRVFWALLLAFYFFPAANQLFFIHLVAHLTDAGLDRLTAAFILSLAGLFSIPGRMAFGWLTDRYGGLVATQLSFTLSILAVVLILLPGATNLLSLYLFALVFGLSLGSRGVALGAFTANTFPGPEFGVIYGWITAGQLIGGAGGPWLGGLVFDALGSYRTVFYGCIGGFVLSALLIGVAALGRRPQSVTQGADQPN